MLGLALGLAPATAAAWCLLPGSYTKYWQARFPEQRIAVYMAVGEGSTVLYSQLTREQVATVLQRVIAVHNETVGTPTLYYAGETEAQLDADGGQQARPPGIVVDSFACPELGGVGSCSKGQLACTQPGGNADELLSKARVTLQPSLCGNAVVWGIERGQGKDVTRVLLHEFGHALGLGHATDPHCPGPRDEGTFGVMQPIVGDDDAYERAWRSDDIAGLRVVHGGALRHGVYVWVDDAFPAAPEESARVAVCAEIRTPPALTTAVAEDEPRSTLLMGFTDAEDRVSLLEWDGARFVAPVGGAVVDPSPAGISLAPVGLAHSDADGVAAPVVMAVWSSDDSRTARANRLRWGVRPLAGGPWEYGYFAVPMGATQTANRVTVGYDAANEWFLVVSLTDQAEPYVIVVDGDGTQLATVSPGTSPMAPLYAFDVGRPVCRADGEGSRCVVPFTSGNHLLLSSEPVLQPGWMELAVGADASVVLEGRAGSELLDSFGLMDLAGGAGGMRGVAGEQRFALGYGDEAPVVDSARLAGGDWPLRIGSRATAGGATSYFVAARRSPGVCGDGVVDCAEDCDDGNGVGGDGCSAQCGVEAAAETTAVSPTGEGGDASTGAAGTSSGGGSPEVSLADDGCGCVAGGAGPLGLVLLGLGRRRRARGRG